MTDAPPEAGADASADDAPKSAAAKLFDIRLMIGALFVLYGLMLIGAGFFTSDADMKKASDLNINLYLGIGMLVLGLLFLLWRKLNPTVADPEPDTADDRAEVRRGQH